MPAVHFFNMVLRDGHFQPSSGMYASFDEAIAGIEQHFGIDPNLGDKAAFRNNPKLQFTTYLVQGDDRDWGAAIVEVNLKDRQMMNLAIYKVCKGLVGG